MNFLFVIQNMKIGGVQKSLLNITNELLKDGNNVDYLIIDFNGDLINKIDKSVNIINLPIKNQYIARLYQMSFKDVIRTLKIKDIIMKTILSVAKNTGFSKSILKYILKNIKIENEYDTIISFDGMPSIADEFVASVKCNAQRVAWVHNDIKYFNISIDRLKKHYSRFDRIGIVSEACRFNFIDLIPELCEKAYTVYNTFNIEEILEKSNMHSPYIEDKNIIFVNVGRMQHESKRIDRIIDSVQRLKTDGYEDYKVYLVGDGPSRNYYEKLVKDKEIQDQVIFIGKKENPYPYMKFADVFIMSSQYEGYGMTLKESLILGTPCITTGFAAASEVIINNKTGLISEVSTEGIYSSMKHILDNPIKINEYKKNIEKIDKSNYNSKKQFYRMIKGEEYGAK